MVRNYLQGAEHRHQVETDVHLNQNWELNFHPLREIGRKNKKPEIGQTVKIGTMEIAYLLSFQKTQVQNSEPTVQDSQLPVTSAPGESKPSSGLLG